MVVTKTESYSLDEAEQMIDVVLERLRVEENVKSLIGEFALDLIEHVCMKSTCTDQKLKVLVATCLYLVLTLYGYGVDMQELANMCGCKDSEIKQVLYELMNRINILVLV